MPPVAAASAFMNNTPIVAMFMPVVTDWCKKTGISPSKLFIPLSYAAVLGGCCTLIGTSTNLVVQGLMIAAQKTDPTMPRLGFWTLGAVGLPVTILGILFILLTSKWLLRDRQPASLQHADPRQYTSEMVVQPGGGVDGRAIEQAGLRNLPGAFLIEVQRGEESFAAVGPDHILRADDRLIFAGVVGSIVDLQKIRGLAPATNQVFKLSEPRHNRVLIEAVVSNTCPMVGMTIREGRFRTRYDAAVIAVHRNGERIDRQIGQIELRPGDTLLLEAHPRFLQQHRDSRDFFLVSAVADSKPPRHEKAWIAVGILGAMVVAMTFESRISVLTSALIAAGLMLAARCVGGEDARRAIDWPTLVAIGASFGLARGLETTGAATFLGSQITQLSAFMGTTGALVGVYLVTLLFTELITNNAAAALAFPLARAAAVSADANFLPFAVVIAIAASAGFATPLGYQTHLMVYGPGGYRFSDFVRIGLPLDALVLVVTVVLTPIFFPL
jgi:di/tricarboxylate transporter